jgi:peptidoglycan-N-acetylglucosamine deacetylase
VAIESYSLEKILREIQVQHQLLALVDTTRKERAFAFPCNNTIVANTDYSTIIHEKGLVTFGRGGGDSNSIVNLKDVNPRLVPSWLVEEGTTTAQLIAFAEKARKNGGMAVYQFHGIGAEFFRVDAGTHKAFLNYLASHRADYQVLTFSAAMQRISAGIQ